MSARPSGRVLSGCEELSKCARFYPHLAHGEGQFAALLYREESVGTGEVQRKAAVSRLTKEEEKAVTDFIKQTVGKLEDITFFKLGSLICLLPNGIAFPSEHLMWAGVPVGEAVKGRLVPHHAFFSAYGEDFCRKLDLSLEDPRLYAYLHGDTVPAPDLSDGFCAVLVDGMPLGGGKAVSGVLKNHYPKGLRSQF